MTGQQHRRADSVERDGLARQRGIADVLAWLLLAFLVWCLALVLLAEFSTAAADAGLALTVGWGRFFLQNFSSVIVDRSAILMAAGAALLLAGLLRLVRQRLAFRGTVVVAVVFIVGTAFTALTRNLIWLVRSDEPLSHSGRVASVRSQAKNQLKQLGLAMHNFHEVHGAFPSGGLFDESGVGLNSWTTDLLPYLGSDEVAEFAATIQHDEPWDAPANQLAMQRPVPELLGPNMPESTWVDDRGFAATHYSGNAWLLGPNSSLAIRDITDGTTNTLMIGQIRDQIPAWGNPVNWRDPTRRLNSPGAFGSLHVGVVQFLLADGSVRAISENVDSQVMQAISSPNGGEPVGAF